MPTFTLMTESIAARRYVSVACCGFQTYRLETLGDGSLALGFGIRLDGDKSVDVSNRGEFDASSSNLLR
jgi:hypothetical protein